MKINPTTKAIFDIISKYKSPDDDTVIAFKLRASNMKNELMELIAEKYKLLIKYQKEEEK